MRGEMQSARAQGPEAEASPRRVATGTTMHHRRHCRHPSRHSSASLLARWSLLPPFLVVATAVVPPLPLSAAFVVVVPTSTSSSSYHAPFPPSASSSSSFPSSPRQHFSSRTATDGVVMGMSRRRPVMISRHRCQQHTSTGGLRNETGRRGGGEEGRSMCIGDIYSTTRDPGFAERRLIVGKSFRRKGNEGLLANNGITRGNRRGGGGGGEGINRVFGKGGGINRVFGKNNRTDSRWGSGDRGRLPLARLACCALLPSFLALAGFAPAAAAAASETGAAALPQLLANRWYVWVVLMASSSAGLWSERTRWGAAVSSPLVTMLLTITLCNLGALPPSSPAYDTVNQVFVPLAVPLLLFDADLRKVLRFAGTLLACFVIGAAGTVIGTAVAAAVVPVGLGSDGWKIASALAARHIGGAVNYVAVCETLGVSADAVVAGLAADNMVVSLYFVFLFWVTKPEKQEATTQLSSSASASAATTTTTTSTTDTPVAAPPTDAALASATSTVTAPAPLAATKEAISYALTAACALCLSGELLSKLAFGGRVSAIPLVTLVTVAGATAAPSIVGRLGPVGAQLGVLLMQLFFSVTGAQGSLAVVMGTAPSLLVFSLVQIAVHFGVLVGVGRLFRLPFRELALASNANVGGPTTAAAMAAAKGWKNLVLPALLTGVLGYATATFIGVGIGHALLKTLV